LPETVGCQGVFQDDQTPFEPGEKAQLRDYRGISGHTAIARKHYILLVDEQRCHDDLRTIGSLFFACIEEIKDFSMIEALQRLLGTCLWKI